MKAIAIIEVPEGGKGKWYINGEIRYTENRPLIQKFDIQMIPLKRLPCKKYMRQMPSDVLEKDKRKRDFIIHKVDVDNSYAEGWNDCLAEITGETE